jgi:urease accessory protein
VRAGRKAAIGATLLLVLILNYPAQDNSWLVWQLADSAFPSGGFAHSGGLEAAWQQGEIRDAEELASFIESALWQTAAGALPFVTAAHDAPERLPELDEHCDTFLSNHVANRASRLQGRAFLSSSLRIFPALQAQGISPSGCHLAPIFGVIAAALKIGRSHAAELFFFQALRGLIAAAVRLGVAGPMEGQALQHRLAPRAREILGLTDLRGVNDIATIYPLLEIWHATHDRLYSRLFQT